MSISRISSGAARGTPHRPRPFLLLAASATLAAAACAGRQVEVSTGAAVAPAMSLDFTNNLRQAVNVYVRAAGANEIFLRQVAAGTAERIAVRGVASGSTVTFRAAPVDGSQGYTRENVALSGDASWRIP